MFLRPFKNIAFSKAWFEQFNYLFTYLLNNKSFKIRSYLRDKLKLNDFDYNIPIVKLTPNSVHYAIEDKIVMVCYSYERIANRLKIEFENIFIALHEFDLRIANKFMPILNLGYDTLTVYSSIADGYVGFYNNDFTTARDATTGNGTLSNTTSTTNAMRCALVTATYYFRRGFFYFDTSSIGAGSSVTAATLSIYGAGTATTSVSVQEGTQSATLSDSDYGAFTGALFASVTWGLSYRNFILDSYGQSYVNNNSNARFCCREYTKDYLNIAPTTNSNANGCYFSDNTGTTNDPKLVITYSAGAAATTRSYIY